MVRFSGGRSTTGKGYIFNLSISDWGRDKLLKGQYSYNGIQDQVEVILKQSKTPGEENQWKGEGSFSESWGHGKLVCHYRTKLELSVYQNENYETLIYERNYSPTAMYSVWNYLAYGCPPAGNEYVWQSSDPYKLEE